MDDIQLSELYFALSAKFNECIAEAASVKNRCCPQEKQAPHDHNIPQNLLSCVRGSEFSLWGSRGSREVGSSVAQGSKSLTSQQRTRRRKRSTSDCFFFWSSSTYLRAPICEEVSVRLEGTRQQAGGVCDSRHRLKYHLHVSSSPPAQLHCADLDWLLGWWLSVVGGR